MVVSVWWIRIVVLTGALLGLVAWCGDAFAVGDYGPETCQEGFVWREACGPNDHVCVTPQSRAQAAQDDALAASRREPNGGPYGPDTCRQGFVWREACGPQDHVCVPAATRTQAARDNAMAASRFKQTPILWDVLTQHNDARANRPATARNRSDAGERGAGDVRPAVRASCRRPGDRPAAVCQQPVATRARPEECRVCRDQKELDLRVRRRRPRPGPRPRPALAPRRAGRGGCAGAQHVRRDARIGRDQQHAGHRPCDRHPVRGGTQGGRLGVAARAGHLHRPAAPRQTRGGAHRRLAQQQRPDRQFRSGLGTEPRRPAAAERRDLHRVLGAQLRQRQLAWLGARLPGAGSAAGGGVHHLADQPQSRRRDLAVGQRSGRRRHQRLLRDRQPAIRHATGLGAGRGVRQAAVWGRRRSTDCRSPAITPSPTARR